MVAISVEKSDIDPPIEITVLELDSIGLVKEIGIEDGRAVGSIRLRDGLRLHAFEKTVDRSFVLIIFLKIPVEWRRHIP